LWAVVLADNDPLAAGTAPLSLSERNPGAYPDRGRTARTSLWVMTEMAATADFDADQPVIEAVQQGDHIAFRELLRRQERWVRGIVYAVLGDRDRVDDVVQQVWTTLWERCGELRDARRWRPWLYRLARNAAVDAGRETTRRRTLSDRLAESLNGSGGEQTPPGELAEGERREAVLDAIAALPVHYREPFVLRHLEDWSYREIAAVLDLPVDTVETRLVRARRLLREALGGRL
jgi:RNA polymerase sigma-70 factor (ECF subfamily)